jgi:thiosulfate/3-mercaptopyruvate sulfurtransferase
MTKDLQVSPQSDAEDESTLRLSRRRVLWTLTGSWLAILAGCRHADASGGDGGASLPRMAPSDLHARLGEVGAKIELLHVGPAYLFGKAHIPHARHPGEASTADGYAAIVAELRKLAADREVVFYCGCCPTKNCPNITPAERAAREVGLLRASILDLPTTLKADWSDHGYPVEKS